MARDTNAEQQAYSLREIRLLIEAPLRRPLLLIIPLLLVVVGAVILSYVLPPRYTSSTLILLAPDTMPTGFVPQLESTDHRLLTLRQEIESRTRLEMAARELDPYGTLGKEPLIKTIERMREGVSITIKGKDAFSIAFEHTDPRMAMLVAGRLTTLFMEDVIGQRKRQVSVAYEFIEEQLQQARTELEAKEKALTEFKERHMGTLPEQVSSNLATLQRLQMEHRTISDSLSRAADNLVLLESGAAATPGGSSQADGQPVDSLSVLRAHLTQLLSRYTPEHPDVKALQARIAAMEQAAMASGEVGAEKAIPVDPVAARARMRVLEARAQVEDLKRQLRGVEERIAAFQARVEAAPRMEQEIVSLTRDYEKLRENYSSLLSKKFDAEMAAQLEQYSKRQQFRIIDPAYLPEEPSFPDRLMFVVGGILGGLLLGVGLAATVDLLDPTIKDVQELRAALPYPVLAVIPYVKPRHQRRLAVLSSDDTQPSPTTRRRAGRRGARNTLPFRKVGGGRSS